METLPILRDVQSLTTMADMMVQSGFFKEARDIAKAFVVIKAGEEMGIPAVASMRQIELVNGQISIRAHLVAAMIKRSGRYNYRVRESTDKKCRIEFYEDGESVGITEYTWDDAVKAKLTEKDAYKKHPADMMYNRAMARGGRMHCADIFLGGVYVEGEIEGDLEPSGYEVVNEPREPQDVTPPAMPVPAANKGRIGVLNGELKRLGVRDGHKTRLTMMIYPEGISDYQARGEVGKLKVSDKLPEMWINEYTKLLMEESGIPRNQLDSDMKAMWGTANPRKFDASQQAEFIAWLSQWTPEAPQEATEIEDDDDIPEIVTPQQWANMIGQKCTELGMTTSTDLESWAVNEFSDGSVFDPTHLGIDAYNAIQAMNTVELRQKIDEFKSEGDQVELI